MSFIFVILLSSGLIASPVFADTVPEWFKNNAVWWNEDLITDSEIIAALESLIIQDVIPLEKFVNTPGLEHQASVQNQGTFVQIPSYQKDVFGFWADGDISDDEVLNSISFLISEGIINSERIQDEIERRNSDHTLDSYYVLDSQSLGFIFETAKQNEVSMKYLQIIKAAEYDFVKNAYDSALSDYSKNRDQISMNTMISLGNAEKIAQSNSLLATQILKTSLQSVKDAKDMAVKSGLHVLDLEKSISDKQLEIDSMNRHFSTESEIKSAYKDAQKSQKIADDGLHNFFHSIVADNPQYQKLSSNDKNFVSTVIHGIEYSDFRLLNSTETLDDTVIPPDFTAWDDLSQMSIMMAGLFTGKLPLPGYDELYDGIDFNEEKSENATINDDTLDNWDPTLNDDSDLWDSSNYYLVSIPLPDGSFMEVIDEFPEGNLGNLLNSDIIEGGDMIRSLDFFDMGLLTKAVFVECDIDDLDCEYIPTVEFPKVDEEPTYYPGLEELIEVPSLDVDDDGVISEVPVDDTIDDTIDDDFIWITGVHFIDDKAYPSFQFMILARSSSDDTCPNGTFAPVSQSYNTIYHLDSDVTGLIYDESANNNCGNFGDWTAEASEEHFPITQAQGEFMSEKFDFDFQFESYSKISP